MRRSNRQVRRYVRLSTTLAVTLATLLAGCADDLPAPPTGLKSSNAPVAGVIAPDKVGAVTASFIQTDDAAMNRLISMMNQAGITWARELMNWHQLQPYALHVWNDALVQDYHRVFAALRAANIKVFVTLQGTPEYACSTPNVWCDTFQAPVPAQFTAFVRDVMAEFWEVDYWGVYNEPYWSHMWHTSSAAPYYGNSYEAYKQTVHAAATALHFRRLEGQWTKKVVAYENGDSPWLMPLFSAIGNDIDVVTLHSYAYSWDAVQQVANVDAKLRTIRPQGWPIWLGEMGWHNGNPTDEQQATNLIHVFQAQEQASITNWQRTFVFHLWEPQGGNHLAIIDDATSANPVPRLAYTCLQRFTHGEPLNPPCTAAEH